MNTPERLLILQRQLVVIVLFLIVLSFVFLLGFHFADVLRILGISLILSYMAINIVDWLEKQLHNRALAVGLVYTGMLALLVVAALLVVPALIWQISQMIQTIINEVPSLLEKVTRALIPLEERFRACQIEIKAVDILNNTIGALPKSDPAAVISRITDVAMGTMTWLFYGISISIITFYFLLDGTKLKESFIKLFPRNQQNFFYTLAADIDKNLQSFFRGQIVLGLAFGLIMLCIYLLLGVQYALLLSIFLGIMEILPVLGPPLGFLPAIISVGIHGMSIPGNKLSHVIILTVIFTVLQQFKDNVVGPKYIGNVIGLHPIMVFIAIMIGARIDGALGIIFSLPVACVLNVAFSHTRACWSENSLEEIKAVD